MTFKQTKIEGAWVIEPKIFTDNRGMFCETWNSGDFSDLLGIHHEFVQMNHSRSNKNVLRGLHYQTEYPQAKLVWVNWGVVLDVFVDLRWDSLTFGQWDSVELNGLTRLYIPAGCAHGFVVKSDVADFNYLVSDFRYPEHEKTLIWNDKELDIDWGIDNPILSVKDQKGLTFKECEKYGD